jgi:predicted nucleic acid-binding protein
VRFTDTNILLYAVSRHAGERPKQVVAAELLAQRDLGLSVKVLREFYVQATRATRDDRLTHRQAASLVTAFSRFPVQPITVPLIHAAIESRRRFDLSYWDAAIVEAARMLGCSVLLSEDLSHGQDYDGVAVINPFR